MSNDNRPNFLSPAALAVLQERRGQVEREGFSVEHDDAHDTGELAMAASTYALAGVYSLPKAPWTWPFEKAWWKPGSPRQNLVKAAALLIAEIERIDRLDAEQRVADTVALEPVSLTYTNWRGETSMRSIVPQFLWYGSTEWHPQPQWMIRAFDVDKGAYRDFALRDFGAPAAADSRASFQNRVQPWMMACFGAEISADKLERGDRFLEEALELVQSGDYPKDRVYALVEYVYGRNQGEINQEVGGVMITLAAYCLAHGLDMHDAGETELARIWTKVEKIRAKQAAKPTGSALPIAIPASPSTAPDVEMEIARVVQSVNEWDDRTSPEDFPEALLITSEELALILRNFSVALTGGGSAS